MAIEREYLSPNEIAELLGVSPFTIRRYIKLGELKAVKLLGGFRVHRDDLQRFLKAHEVNSNQGELSPEEPPAEIITPELETRSKASPVKSQPAPRRPSLKTGPASRSRRRKPGKKKLGRPIE